MKKISILAVAAIALLSCSKTYKSEQVELTNMNDSINYALGYANGANMKQYQLRNLEEDQLAIAATEYADALQRGWDGEKEELTEAQQAGRNIGSGVKNFEKNGLANILALPVDEKVLFQGLINGIYHFDTLMTTQAAQQYFQEQYRAAMADTTIKEAQVKKAKCGNKAKLINLKTKSDSINYAFGYMQGEQIGMYVLMADTDGSMHKELVEAINHAKKNGYEFPQLVNQAENVGQAIKADVDNGLMGMKHIAIDIELIKRGFINGMFDELWSLDEAGQYIESVINADNKKKGEEFLQENLKNDSVKVTESGLQYKVLVEGKGPRPTAEQTVKVNYEGSLIDGTVFDSSYRRGEPISFGLNQVIKGWTEGLQLMPVGSTYMLYIPYELAYGEGGTHGIPGCSALIFKVELLGIEKNK